MIIKNCVQGSYQWEYLRLGIPTGSNFSKIITGTGKPSKSAGPYREKLLIEYLSGKTSDTFQSDWMLRGIEMEQSALLLYSFLKNVELQSVGLIFKDDYRLVSCSPDSLIKGQKKGVEIKCPSPKIHEKYLKDNKLPTKHIPQVQGHMYITGFKSWDFMSYHPDYEPLMITVLRDDDYISFMDELINDFIKKLLHSRRLLNKVA